MNYDRLATAITADHETFTADLRSLLFGARLAGQLTPAAAVEVDHTARAAMHDFLRAADALAVAHLDEVFGGVLPGPVALAQRTVLLRPLRSIAVREIDQLKIKMRGAGLRALIGDSSSALAQLAKRADERFEPTATDSAGRTWRAGALVKFLARDFGYQSFIDGRAFQLQRDGATEARVVYLDPQHEHYGLVVALPLSGEIRSQIFHPNANAQLTHVLA